MKKSRGIYKVTDEGGVTSHRNVKMKSNNARFEPNHDKASVESANKNIESSSSNSTEGSPVSSRKQYENSAEKIQQKKKEFTKKKRSRKSYEENNVDIKIKSKKMKAECDELKRNLNEDSESEEDIDNLMLKQEKKMEKFFQENKHLRSININISWEVPPTHLIEKTVLRSPSKDEIKQFKKYPMKRRFFLKEEDNIIRNNFSDFCEEYNLKHDPTPFLTPVVNGKSLISFPERRKFIMYLGKGLDYRTLYTIYNRFKILYQKRKIGKFSAREDKFILKYMQEYKYSLKLTFLANILNRTKAQLGNRYEVLTKIEEFTKIPCRQRIQDLVAAMMDVLKISTIEEMKFKNITAHHWYRISQLMYNTPVYEIKLFWRQTVKTRLFNHDININKVLREIIEVLDKRKVTDWKQINWDELIEPYKDEHYTWLYVYLKFKDLRRYLAEKYQKNPRICIRVLKDLYEQHDKLLSEVRSLDYVDGRIIKIKKENCLNSN